MKAWHFYAVILGVSAILVGCTHDFDAFDPTTDEGGTTGDGGSNDGASDACTPASVCTNNAKSCATQCTQIEMSCEGDCNGGGGSKINCRNACADAGVSCTTECVSTCVTCAGCNGQTACEAATK
jgi:hypothetical protein